MRLFLLILFASTLVGCAALDEITPMTQAEADRMIVAQSKDVEQAINGVETGDPLAGILGGAGALLTTILLSRYRRRKQIAAATLAEDKQGAA